MTNSAPRAEILGERPSSARIWAYWLGNRKDSFEVDREAGRAIAERFPMVPRLVVTSRDFHERVVRFMARSGIEQILDLGVGLPLPGRNTHELAQVIAPATRVVYVDNDPVVLAHQQALTRNRTPEGVTAYEHLDLRDVDEVLDRASHTLDLERPVGITLMSVLGHYSTQANDIIRRYVEQLASGSWISWCDSERRPMVVEWETMYMEAEADPYLSRPVEEIRAPVDTEGLELLGNGFHPVTLWREDPEETMADHDPDAEPPQWGVVARKP